MHSQDPCKRKRCSTRAALTLLAGCLVIGTGLAPAYAVPQHPCIANERIGLYHPTQGAVIGTFGFRINPVTGEKVFHTGVDYAVRAGDAVMAAGLGRVKFKEQNGSDDVHVVIDHGRGIEVLYAHLAQTALIAGRCVNDTDVLGLAGHRHPVEGGQKLHVEVRKNGDLVDPLTVFQLRGFRALRR